jgi:glycosyltransferase involved in cell wall biosynthesis
MRIALVNYSSRRIGGTEAYLSALLPELARLGHQLAFLCELDVPESRERIPLPAGTPLWCREQIGADAVLSSLTRWKPDLIYAHGQIEVDFERRLLTLAPGVYFAHNYYGTCISGLKTFKLPVIEPCDRKFGWQCLALYFPRHCGGRSPFTMAKLFLEQTSRLETLRQYDAIVTHSSHMRDEYIKHGIPEHRIHHFAYEVSKNEGRFADEQTIQIVNRADSNGFKLLFVGRMDRLKGGEVLLESLPLAERELNKPLHLTFAGDGPDRRRWGKIAVRVTRKCPNIRIQFTGWLGGSQLSSLMTQSDLLVVPSVWPEPFGKVGPEAGLHGLPAAAFAVGGIPDWLAHGVNGFLAEATPPTAKSFARAICSCLSDRETHARLRRGAQLAAQQFQLKRHLTALLDIFEALTPAHRCCTSAS